MNVVLSNVVLWKKTNHKTKAGQPEQVNNTSRCFGFGFWDGFSFLPPEFCWNEVPDKLKMDICLRTCIE